MTRAERIAAARAALAERYAADPEGVQRFEARMAHIAAVRKRERQRFDHLVLGEKRPEPEIVRPAGMSKAQWKIERKRLRDSGARLDDPDIEARLQLREAWSHKQGHAETLAAAATHTDSMAQMERNGSITKDQVECMAQIANVHRSIEADVGVKVASFEARVDQSRRGAVVAERIHRVRMHRAYAIWRDMLPAPKALALDMIVGDAVGYTVAARRHHVHNRRAKRVLVDAIDCWPLCVARAFSIIDQPMVDAMNDAVPPSSPVALNEAVAAQPVSYELARVIEIGRERTDEAYLLPPVDPIFLDERGYLLPWDAIAGIVRERVAEMTEAA